MKTRKKYVRIATRHNTNRTMEQYKIQQQLLMSDENNLLKTHSIYTALVSTMTGFSSILLFKILTIDSHQDHNFAIQLGKSVLSENRVLIHKYAAIALFIAVCVMLLTFSWLASLRHYETKIKTKKQAIQTLEELLPVQCTPVELNPKGKTKASLLSLDGITLIPYFLMSIAIGTIIATIPFSL